MIKPVSYRSVLKTITCEIHEPSNRRARRNPFRVVVKRMNQVRSFLNRTLTLSAGISISDLVNMTWSENLVRLPRCNSSQIHQSFFCGSGDGG